MPTTSLATELSRLFSMEVEAIEAYSNAVSLVGPGPLRDEIVRFGLEHQRHGVLLEEQLVRRGVTPPDVTPDVKGVVIGALAPPQRSLTIEDVLIALRGNEQLTSAVYAKALARQLPEDARELLLALRAEERRHLDWIERALSQRAWEMGAGHP